MATLNTLRTRGGIIVSIVIGVSLLAFLLGDLTSGGGMLGGGNQRVGEIAGQPIDYMEYAQQSDYSTRITQLLSGTDALDEQTAAQAREMAWEEMIMRYSYAPGFAKLGIAAAEAEQQDMVGGVYRSQVLDQMFANPQTGAFDPALLAQFMAGKDSDPSGNAPMVWEYVKEQMVNQRLMTKYLALVVGGMHVTNLEVQQGVAAAGKSFTARYAMAPYTSIADSTIALTNSQIRAYYGDHQAMLRQGESRSVEYVIFDMLPSPEDYAAAQTRVNELAAEFAAAGDAMNFAQLNSTSRPDVRYLKQEFIDPAIAAAIMEGGMYGPQLAGDIYTMARLGGSQMLPDSVGARYIVLAPADSLLADSLVRELRAGADLAALAAQYSLDRQTPGGDMGRFEPEMMMPEVRDALVAHARGDVFAVGTANGRFVMELTYKAAPVRKYQVATLQYAVDPSAATESAVYARASQFAQAAGGTSEQFDAVVSADALSERTARIAVTDRQVSGLPGSLELVRWAFTEKQGAVSPIMEVEGDYVVATLTEVRHEGIAPLEQAAPMIRQQLIRESKAAQLAAKMQGSSLDAIAAAVGARVDTAANVQQSSFFIDGTAGVEPALIGAIAASTPGVISKPVEGMQGVYVFQVDDVATLDAEVTPDAERVRLEATAGSYIGERVNQALRQVSQIEDMRVKFF